jgi:hypothetical protein
MSAVFGLAWAGLGRGQAPLPVAAPAAAPRERIMAVQETGKPSRKCRLLKTWREADGGTAYEVQALDNKEILTVVEVMSGPGPDGKAHVGSIRICHWGNSQTPPPGTPVAPPIAAVYGVPTMPTAAAVTPAVASMAPMMTPTQAPRLQPTPQPPLAEPFVAGPPVPQTAMPVHPAGDCGCMTSPGSCSPCDSCGSSVPARLAGVVRPGDAPAPSRPSLMGRLLHKNQDDVVVSPAVTPPMAQMASGSSMVTQTQAPAPATAPMPVAAQPAPQNASGWGQVQPWQPAGSAPVAAAPQAVTPTRSALFTLHKTDKSQSVQTVQATDPTQDPSWYQQKALASSKRHADDSSQDTGWLGRKALFHKEAPKPEQPGMARASDRPGMGSVLSAPGASTDAGPNAFGGPMPSPMPSGEPPQPPDPFNGRQWSMGPQGPQLPTGTCAPMGYANAFTHGHMRPVPADADTPQPPENAFAATYLNTQPFMGKCAPAGVGAGMCAPSFPVPAGTLGACGGGCGPVSQAPSALPTRAVVVLKPAPVPQFHPAPGEALPEHASAPQLVGMLKDSLYPSQREWAADCLAGQDWRSHPEAVSALLTAAREDPAGAVRACCVKTLGRMKVNTPAVVQAMQGWKTDHDPRVRHEAEEALAAMTAPAQQQVVPASATVPAGK